MTSASKSITFTVSIVIHKSRNLIGTLRSSELGPKQGQIFHVMLWFSLAEAPSQVKGAQSTGKEGTPDHKSSCFDSCHLH